MEQLHTYQNGSEYLTMKKNNKGFTLVEMIVVMVILTVLAAILIPGLLGWIDEARGKQYVLSARSVYMAVQAIESEKYAAWDGTAANANHHLSEADKERVLRMADADGAVITDVVFESDTLGGDGAASNHAYYTVSGITVKFEGATVTLVDGIWTVIQ
ncbi:MAG: type II secretion system protein [Lachnospiraceae bacterium]|nr:type II secretion system protein [Lachnospiraceae bacterium]